MNNYDVSIPNPQSDSSALDIVSLQKQHNNNAPFYSIFAKEFHLPITTCVLQDVIPGTYAIEVKNDSHGAG